MNFVIRRALPEDVRPALDLALRVFTEYEMPDYEPEALDNFKHDCTENTDYIRQYTSGERFMFVAQDSERIIGMVTERGNGHISMLFVDGAYHRRGIATALMNEMVYVLKSQGINRITLNASPYGLPFYEKYGFMPTDAVLHKDGFVFTPMEYKIVDLNM